MVYPQISVLSLSVREELMGRACNVRGRPWCRWGENTDIAHTAIGCGLILFLQESAHWFDGDGIQH